MSLKFGNRAVPEIAGKLRDPKILAALRQCIAGNEPTWVWPIQVRKYQEPDIRAALALVDGALRMACGGGK